MESRIVLEPVQSGSCEIHFKVALDNSKAIGTVNFACNIRYLLRVGEQTYVGIPTENLNKRSIPYKIQVNINNFLVGFHCKSNIPLPTASLNSENIIDNDE